MSVAVKLPLIWPVPLVIGSLMYGAEITLSSRTIAKKWLMFSVENSANCDLPGSRSVNETARSPVWPSTAGLALSIWSPLKRAGSGTGSGWPSTTPVGSAARRGLRCRTTSAGSGTKSSRPVVPTSFSIASASWTPGSSTTTRSEPTV